MDRGNHYEGAFEAYLQARRLGYIAVDETRRALYGDLPLKSLDFIVFGADGARFVIDVKGRRYPGGPPDKPRHVWECWTAREDIDSLQQWAELSGPDYRGLLVFMYDLQPVVRLPGNIADLWEWRGRRYLLRAIPAAAYRQVMRGRSARWQTVSIPQGRFRAMVRPLEYYTHSQREAVWSGVS